MNKLISLVLLTGVLVSAVFFAFVYFNDVGTLAKQSTITGNNASLKAKSGQTGRPVRSKSDDGIPVYRDVKDVVEHSSAIVIGVALTNASALSSDETDIATNYEVLVQDVLKGALRPGQAITVTLPFGVSMFRDGSFAEVQAPWFHPMQNGSTYILFFSDATDDGVFTTTAGPQGVFELVSFPRPGGTVKSLSGRFFDPIWKHDGMETAAFLEAVRRSVKH